MTDSIETSDREAEDPRKPIRLPVREMRDEPAPQRAAQEGDLPPLPDAIMSYERHPGGFQEPILVKVYSADQMREYARTAIAAAGGGVPQANSIQRRAASLHSKTGMSWDEAEQLALSEAGIDDEAIDELIGECGYSGLESLLTTPDELRRFTRSVLVHQPLASSPQPEAAQPNLVDDEGVMNTPLLRAARLLVSGSHPSKDCAGPYMVPADLWLTLQAEVMESLRQAAARDLANPVQPEAAPAVAQVPQCRSDGRCQYAIDHGAEGLGHCPPGKCAMPAVAQSKDQA